VTFAPTRSYLTAMVAYNAWMNERLYAVCAEMTDEERKRDRGAFFRSIHGTLNHLLLGDLIWLGVFTGSPPAFRSLDQELHADFAELRAARARLDGDIQAWAEGLTHERLAGDIAYYSMSVGARRKLAMWHAVVHFFNHQTHHRGQLTTLLAQAGKEIGPTDLHRMPGIAISL
jgi:uncharacterized damage-inducible protein DinB